VAIDPAAGKIYWSTFGVGTIRVANLDGTGAPASLFTGESTPVGVAVDSSAGKIYWANRGSGKIRVANLTGGGLPTDLFTGESPAPWGVAIDPAAGKIYWTNNGPGVRVGNLNGTGAAADLFTGEQFTTFLALLHSPVGTGAPAVSGGGHVGQPLGCSQGGWAADLVGSFLYRAPRTFAYQWLKNGAIINGATASTYTPTAGGSYSCRVTAANQAGSSGQTSAPITVVTTPVIAGSLTAVGVSPRTFKLTGRKVKGRCVKPTPKNNNNPHCKRPLKLHITYTLTAPATVTFTLKRLLPGRKVKGRCVKTTSKNNKHKHCTRHKNVAGAITSAGTTGANSFTFNGKIGGHKLGAGAYQLIATTAGGSRSVKFRIAR
jgi:hypothetical protein